jgi:hypothetical protein
MPPTCNWGKRVCGLAGCCGSCPPDASALHGRNQSVGAAIDDLLSCSVPALRYPFRHAPPRCRARNFIGWSRGPPAAAPISSETTGSAPTGDPRSLPHVPHIPLSRSTRAAKRCCRLQARLRCALLTVTVLLASSPPPKQLITLTRSACAYIIIARLAP